MNPEAKTELSEAELLLQYDKDLKKGLVPPAGGITKEGKAKKQEAAYLERFRKLRGKISEYAYNALREHYKDPTTVMGVYVGNFTSEDINYIFSEGLKLNNAVKFDRPTFIINESFLGTWEEVIEFAKKGLNGAIFVSVPKVSLDKDNESALPIFFDNGDGTMNLLPEYIVGSTRLSQNGVEVYMGDPNYREVHDHQPDGLIYADGTVYSDQHER